MKKLLFLLLSFLISFSVFAQTSKKTLNLGILNGPSAVPVAYLIENKDSFQNIDLNFFIFSGADTELPKLLKGEIDIGILPPNAAAKVYNSSKKNIVCLAVIGEGNISVLTTQDNCNNLKDLKGKTVSCAGRGATPEYMFRKILKENNISSVTLDFSIPNAELASALISGKTDVILVPEPFATVSLMKGKDKGVRKIVNLTTEYQNLQKGTLKKSNFPLTLLVASKKAITEKKDLIDEYLNLYKTSVIWTNENPSEAGLLVEKHTLGLNHSIAEASIPYSAFTFIPSKTAKNDIEDLLKLFYESNPESIGGKLPDEEFYYNN